MGILRAKEDTSQIQEMQDTTLEMQVAADVTWKT